MRSAGLALLATGWLSALGCGGGGPAWPKSAGTVAVEEWTEDGGESIAPHTTRATAVERSAEPTPEVKVAESAPAKVEPSGEGAGSGSGSAVPPSEAPIELTEEIQGEEIIIEIEDD